jgi:hypothetical protein
MQNSTDTESEQLGAVKFIRDACSRIKLAHGTNSYDDVLSEELEDIEQAALDAIAKLEHEAN